MRPIDADLLIENIDSWYSFTKAHERGITLSHSDIINKIKAVPTLELNRKTGIWFYKDTNLWSCSECGRFIYIKNEQDKEEFYRFCGRCGTQMKFEDV